MVAAAAPKLQRVLAAALETGGWFGEAHEAEALQGGGRARPRTSGSPRVRTLLAEEARMGMMVGVAVGWALADELTRTTEPERGGLNRMEIRFLGQSCFELSEGDARRAGRPVPEAQQPGRGR